MSEPTKVTSESQETLSSPSAARLVYVMPEDSLSASDQINIKQLWLILWQRRWLVLACALALGIVAGGYAFLAPKWYRAELLLAPAEETAAPSLAGQLGGLAALAGVDVARGNDAESVAVLKSRELARDFIQDLGLLVVFFADEWDADREEWANPDPEERPDLRDAVEYFHKEILRVSQERQTGLVTLAVEWTDPEATAVWAAELVRRVNAKLRERALRDAGANVAYLRNELTDTNVITLQQSIGRLLETELQKLMLARGNEEFAFRVIDSAAVPKDPIRPQAELAIAAGVMLGVAIGTFWALLAFVLREQ